MLEPAQLINVYQDSVSSIISALIGDEDVWSEVTVGVVAGPVGSPALDKTGSLIVMGPDSVYLMSRLQNATT